jgi:uncharacterized protein YidB (DUF937 family)
MGQAHQQEVDMGVLDGLAGSLLGGGQGGGMNPQLLSALAQMFLGQGGGGLQGLLAMFQQKGLGDLAQSWVSTGANLPISAEQIMGVLGHGNIQQLASQSGLSAGDVGAQLAQHLPGLVDNLSPQGQLPDASALEGLLGMLKG